MTTRTHTTFESIDHADRIAIRARQHIFYKIRYAIAVSQPVDKTSIRPDSPLETFFPRKGRRQAIKAFQKALGIDIELLIIKDWLEWAIIISAAITFITLFFTLAGAAIGLAATATIALLAGKFGKQLELVSVKQLTEKIAREHYNVTAGNPTGMNNDEINQLLEQVFVCDVDFAPAPLVYNTRMAV
jgi:fructose-1,6-bisphosphatase/sedoheptulose 1,7-bisphosphatase-like protein